MSRFKLRAEQQHLLRGKITLFTIAFQPRFELSYARKFADHSTISRFSVWPKKAKQEALGIRKKNESYGLGHDTI